MTYSGFLYLLRFVVLLGLCLASSANAATCSTTFGQVGYGSSATEACTNSLGTQATNGYKYALTSVKQPNELGLAGTCLFTSATTQATYISDLTCTCPTTFTSTLVPAGIGSVPDRCQDSCTQTVTTKETSGAPSTWQDFWKNTGNYCTTSNSPPPQCPSPKVLNPAGTACIVVPVCTLPSKLNAAMTACETAVCTSPAVLSNLTGNCEIPACPEGQSRIDGICTTTQCTPPAVAIGGICKILLNCAAPYIEVNGVCTKTVVTTNPDGTATTTTTTATGTGTTSTGTGTGTGTGTSTGTGSGTGTGTSTTTTSTTGTKTTSTTTNGGTGTQEKSECDSATQVCSSTFAAACDSQYQCTGDAIQCAVATATHKAECLLKSLKVDVKNDVAYTEGKQAFDKGTNALGTENGIPVAVGNNISINSQNPYSASCPADMQLFEYKGSSYMLPLSKYCNIFSIMGNIMLLIASLISMKIILKKDD